MNSKAHGNRLGVLHRNAYLITIESIGSSMRIKGAKLTDREVEKRLSKLDIQSFTNRDEQEVTGYASAMDTILEHASEIPLTINYIKKAY